jgi:hypothetical protein
MTLVFGALATASTASASVSAPRAGHAAPGPMIRSHGAHALPRNAVTSSNWSGYAATGRTYSSVSANWTEPTGHCSSGTQYSSFWVGLDGYSSSTVEQTGTDVDCSGRTPQYYGWYEMYPAYPVNFSNTVRPGDSLSGSVTHTGGSSYTLVLTDHTEGWTQTIHSSLSGAANSSAEAIVEAPCCKSNGQPLNLADFGTANFSSVTANGSPISSFNPTEIIMVNNEGQDKDTISSSTDGNSFTATWLRQD